MSVTEEWNLLMSALAERGSSDALRFLPPAPAADVARAEAATTVWPDQLREFYSLHNGLDRDNRERHCGELLPMSVVHTVDFLVEEYEQLVEHGQSELEDDPWTQEQNVGSEAGATSWAYLPEYIPLSGLDSYYYFLDTRPGEHSGCIRHWTRDDGDNQQGPVYASIADMLAAVRHSITTNSKLEDLWTPTFIDDPDWPEARGTLGWTIS